MISYVTLGTSDLAKATAFYESLLGELGAKRLINMDRIVFFGRSPKEPMIAVCVPYNKEAADCGNGNMVSIAAGSKENVDALYKKALSLGATCDGEPGERIPNVFYGAYIRDPDGNKVCFCHM
ncbi:VOC family protein [Alteromonas sp. CYL-A6]|uniref:VOC family protein n=1 Tax=Alteromonas nitratireducens TaxID=3390813 RepID=UPI0034C08111